jgi:hypothetical protein
MKITMGLLNINTGMIGILLLFVGYHVALAWWPQPQTELPGGLPLPVMVGKSRSFVSMTRDAGMFTEKSRRCAIINGRNTAFGYKGSTNGSLETFFISGVCGVAPIICPTVLEIEDGGNATTDTCNIVDGEASGELIDGGNAGANVCDV